MGVRGLTGFVRDRQFVQSHRLHDCTVIIDGMNLVFTIYFKYQRNKLSSIFGGDYSLFRAHVEQFFHHLKACNVTPLVIIDGSLDPSLEKLKTIKKRSKEQLNNAFKISQSNYAGEQILPFLAFQVFEQTLKQMDVLVKRCLYEGDPIILHLAKKLDCAVVTNDADFFLENLSQGVVLLDSLVESCHAMAENLNTRKYLRCSMYKFECLQRVFQFENPSVIGPVSGLILGNDFSDEETCETILKKLPSVSNNSNRRFRLIYNGLKWIAQFRTIAGLIEALATILKGKGNKLFDQIRKASSSSIPWKNEWNDEPLEDVVEMFFQSLSQDTQRPSIPNEMLTRHINCELSSAILSIGDVQIDWCRPLIEDFTIGCCFETSFEVNNYIYALLTPRLRFVTRYNRQNTKFSATHVSYHELVDPGLLPKLSQISVLGYEENLQLFYEILKLPNELHADLYNLFANFSYCDQFKLKTCMLHSVLPMLVSLIYMLKHFPNELWLEFIYAIIFSIFTIGNNCPGRMDRLFRIHKSQRSVITERLNVYNQTAEFSHSQAYIPRIVHLYNVLQVTHFRINMLIDLLSLHSYRCPFPLNGTFLYNLTIDLSRRPKPYLYMQELLGRQAFKGTALLHQVVQFIVDRSLLGRRFYSKSCDKDVAPEALMAIHSESSSKLPETPSKDCIFRVFQVTNRATHINSQKLKLKK